jgi:hypothetical protein
VKIKVAITSENDKIWVILRNKKLEEPKMNIGIIFQIKILRI